MQLICEVLGEVNTEIEDNKLKLSIGEYKEEIELKYPIEKEKEEYNNNILKIIFKRIM